ncbi:hypothetical protein [Flavobacterium tegetincola]|uniref:hypothetical protein n=1 Tax=Flavobacterium tegetincola TaxID=150172 RepID=UPI0004131C77|nr:hypothetical protein [Flavobacterium tegetincola]
MKKIFLGVFIIFLFFSCKSSCTKIGSKNANYIPYYLKVYEADSLFVVGNYQDSYDILDNLFKKYEPINTFKFDEYSTFCKLKIILNKKLNQDDFFKLVSKYGYDNDWLETDSILSSYYKTFEKMDIKYKSARELYLKSINLKLRNDIVILINQDQKYRIGNKTSESQQMRNYADSVNQTELMRIFRDFGYPNMSMIGNYTIDKKLVSISPILYHTSTSINNEYFFKNVFENMRQGNEEPDVYAFMIDRFNMFRNITQIYGTFKDNLKLSEREINKNRHLIGLPSLGYVDWKNNLLNPEPK